MALLPACKVSPGSAFVVRVMVRRLPDGGTEWYTAVGDGAAALSAGPDGCPAAAGLCWSCVAAHSSQSRLTGKTASLPQQRLPVAPFCALCRMTVAGTASTPQLALRLTTGTGQAASQSCALGPAGKAGGKRKGGKQGGKDAKKAKVGPTQVSQPSRDACPVVWAAERALATCAEGPPISDFWPHQAMRWNPAAALSPAFALQFSLCEGGAALMCSPGLHTALQTHTGRMCWLTRPGCPCLQVLCTVADSAAQ